MNTIVQQIEHLLCDCVPDNERKAITYWLLEETTGMSRTDILCGKCTKIVPDTLKAVERIRQHEPVQYIFGHTYWRGMQLKVNPSVLIPRPETSELIDWILSDNTTPTLSLMDVGTGSGCIAIALKKERPDWLIQAIDISPDALAIAKQNGTAQHTSIQWIEADMLHLPQDLHADIVVANPPYILNSEKTTMDPNVLNYEPSIALFVEDNDPLLFYRALIRQHIAPTLYFEINPLMQSRLSDLLKEEGYPAINIKRDMQGKQRMLKASL